MSHVFEPSAENCQQLAQLFNHHAQQPQDSQHVFAKIDELAQLSGFRYVLTIIISNNSMQSHGRIFAAACLKNLLSDWWKRASPQVQTPNGTPMRFDDKEEERRIIRQQVLQLFLVETDPHITSLLAGCISIISTLDFPTYWPDFATTFFQQLLNTVVPVKTNDQVTGFQLNSNAGKSQEQIIALALRIFDTLNLTLNSASNRSEAIRDGVILPYLEISYQLWILYSSLLNQLLSQYETNINSVEYVATFKTILELVAQVTMFISKCVSSQPEFVVTNLNLVADNIFQSFGQCISSFQAHIHNLPSHQESIVVRNHLNTIRGHCSQCISGCISHSPVLFRKYLEPYTTLFINIIQERAKEKTNEFALLALQHSCEEVGIGWDNEDQSDLSLRGQDPCIINAFQFLTKIISNPNYRDSSTSSKTSAILNLQVRQHDLQSVLETTELAQKLMNETWTKNLSDIIIRSFLLYNRYEVQQICNSSESFFFLERELTSDNSEKHAAMECLQKLHSRTPDIITQLINDHLRAIEPRFLEFFDQPFVEISQNVSKSDLILYSWYIDSVLLAVVALVNLNSELIQNIDFGRLRSMIVQYYRNFTQKLVSSQPQQSQANAMIPGQGIIDKITLESCPTTIQRLLATFKLTEHLPQYVNHLETYELWTTTLPLCLIDNFFIKLTTSNVIRNFADNLAITDDNGRETTEQETQLSTMTLQQSVTVLINYCVVPAQETEAKQELLLSIKTCLATKQLSALIQLLPLIIPVLHQLWNTHQDEIAIAQQIIGIIERLVSGLGPLCHIILDFVVSILNHILIVESLLDNAFVLWQILLENVPFLTKSLLDLFPHWLQGFKEYPEMFTEVGSFILRHYLLLSAFNNNKIPELKKDIEYLMTNQLPTIQQQLPQPILTLMKQIPQPHPETIFDLYGEQLLDCFMTFFTYIEPEQASQVFDEFDILLRCVDPAQLFSITMFTDILTHLASQTFPAIMYELAISGHAAFISHPSSVAPQRITDRQVIQQISHQLCGSPEFFEVEQSVIISTLCLFSRLAIQCPQQFVQFFSQISIPNLGPDTPAILQNPLNIYFAASLYYCNEHFMAQLFSRKQYVLGLLESWAMYQFCGQQLPTIQSPNIKQTFQQFISLMDNNKFIFNLWVIILTECAEDEIPENRYQSVPILPINLADTHFQRTDSAFSARRSIIITNHDITATTRVNDLVVKSLNLAAEMKGRDFISQFLKSLPLHLMMQVDLRR